MLSFKISFVWSLMTKTDNIWWNVKKIVPQYGWLLLSLLKKNRMQTDKCPQIINAVRRKHNKAIRRQWSVDTNETDVALAICWRNHSCIENAICSLRDTRRWLIAWVMQCGFMVKVIKYWMGVLERTVSVYRPWLLVITCLMHQWQVDKDSSPNTLLFHI